MRIALWLILTLISCQALGATRCDAPLSAVEKIICDPDTGLLALDDQLNESYQTTLEVVPDKSALRKEQRAWLQLDRDVCQDWMCVERSMRKRLVDLYNQRLDAKPPLENNLDYKGAQQACSDIGRLASRRLLGAYTVAADAAVKPSKTETHFLPFQFMEGYSIPLRPGQSPNHYGLINTGGSCLQFTIMPLFPVPTQAAPVSATSDELPDDDHYLACNTRDEFVFIGRRFYLVGTTGEAPVLVQWVAPDASMTQICQLRPTNKVLTVAKATEPKTCAAQAVGDLSIAKWKIATLPDEVVNSEAAAPRAAGGRILASAEVADVDLTGDGTVEHVARLSWSFTGGNLGNSVSFVILAKNQMTVSNSPLTQQLAKVYLDPDPDIVFRGKRAYVTGGTRDNFPDEGLVSVASNPSIQVCTFKSQTAYKILQIFPSTGTSAP